MNSTTDDDRNSGDHETNLRQHDPGGPGSNHCWSYGRDSAAPTTTSLTYTYELGEPSEVIEHDTARKLFRITDAEGRVTEFHDRPVRFLVVVPDPVTGEIHPSRYGTKARILWLCREAGL